MIVGAVSDSLEATVPLRIIGMDGAAVALDAVVDTGFTGELTLPQDTVTDLGLEYADSVPAILADGSQVQVEVYECRVAWDGTERRIQVHCLEGTVLVGMSLLLAHRVRLDVIPGGPVTVAALP